VSINSMICGHTVSEGGGAGASLCLSVAAGAVSGRGAPPCSLLALATVAFDWSFAGAGAPFNAVLDELAELFESFERSRSAGTPGILPAILRGMLCMVLGDGFWLWALPMVRLVGVTG
jgi:hypothetical protein